MKRAFALRICGGVGTVLIPLYIGTIAISYASDAPKIAVKHTSTQKTPTEQEVRDAGMQDTDAAAVDGGETVRPLYDTESFASGEESSIRDEEKPKPKLKTGWRLDKNVPRRPGSFIGGSSGAALGYSWFKTVHRDLELEYDLGPMVGSALSIRVGDAFFEWFTVGFQVNIINATFGGVEEPKTAAFALLLDTAFYPWRGLGLKPSVGLGFSYGQAGAESFQIAMGGPATLAFGVCYEFRITPLFTIGPSVQVSWTTGDDYNSLYLLFSLEFLKWFRTAKG
jgi:hypothetical protein